MKINIEVEVPGDKPEDATHFIPENEVFYACWVKKGFSMRIGYQTEWVEDDGYDDPAINHAFKIV